MNTEQLYSIAKAITSDVSDTSVIGHLNALSRALRAQVNAPGAANVQQIESSLQELLALPGGANFQYPETWNSALADLGADTLKNAAFVDEVESAVRGNTITLETAHATVAEVQTRITQINDALSQAVQAFDALGIDGYELAVGSAELSLLVPRSSFDDELKPFLKDMLDLCKFFELAEEISTGSRSSARLDQLSTTDPLIIIGLTPPAVLFSLKVVKDVIEIIKSTYELREARARALAAEASQKTVDALDSDIGGKLEKGLQKLEDRLIREYRSTVRGRTNELRIELKHHLPKLAARIDNGYRIEGSAGEPEAGEEASDAQEAAAINDLSTQIAYTELPPEPVLAITFEASVDGGGDT